MQRLTVPGELASLKVIRDYIQAAAAKAGLNHKTTYHLSVAIDEVVANIIIHGYAETGLKGMLDVQVVVDEKNLIIIIEDTAVPFDPGQQKMPDDLDAPLQDRKIGGLGVYLTMNGVDDFRYEYVAGRNRNILIVYRNEE